MDLLVSPFLDCAIPNIRQRIGTYVEVFEYIVSRFLSVRSLVCRCCHVPTDFGLFHTDFSRTRPRPIYKVRGMFAL